MQFAFYYRSMFVHSRGIRVGLSTCGSARDVTNAVTASRVSFDGKRASLVGAPRRLCVDNFSAIEQLRRHAINNEASRDRGEIKRSAITLSEPGPRELNDYDSDDAESASRCVIRNFIVHYIRTTSDDESRVSRARADCTVNRDSSQRAPPMSSFPHLVF